MNVEMVILIGIVFCFIYIGFLLVVDLATKKEDEED